MPKYKLYRLNGADEIFALVEFQAGNDAAAIETATVQRGRDGVELWRERLLLVSLPARAEGRGEEPAL